MTAMTISVAVNLSIAAQKNSMDQFLKDLTAVVNNRMFFCVRKFKLFVRKTHNIPGRHQQIKCYEIAETKSNFYIKWVVFWYIYITTSAFFLFAYLASFVNILVKYEL